MRGLMGLVNMGRVQNIDRFLGTSYHVNFVSHQTVTVTVAQPAYAAMLLQRYKTARTTQGPLRRVDAPMTGEILRPSTVICLPSRRTQLYI